MLKLAQLVLRVNEDLTKAKTYKEERDALLRMFELVVPEMKLTGAPVFPPAHTSAEDITLILSNHICDADQMLILSQISWHDDQPFPTKCTGFTYSSFQYVPVIGPLVGRSFVGLEKGEPDTDIEHKISWLVDQGFNTWVLFPEGTLFDKTTYAKSLDYQKSLQIPEDQWFHHVLYPRMGALNAFLRVVGKRLRWIVDVTLEYQNCDPRTKEKSYMVYPSALYGSLCGLGSPSMHVHIYDVAEEWKEKVLQCEGKTPQPWLLNLWKLKNRALRKKQQIRLLAKQKRISSNTTKGNQNNLLHAHCKTQE